MEKVHAYLKKIDEVIQTGRYKDNWESLSQITIPDWYKKGKFGIFIHWGAYAVPAFGNEWYPRSMYRQGSPEFEYHRKHYGEHKDFGYKHLIDLFRGESFDAAQWAELFKKSGAKYVTPVAEHHDGFQMYDSDLSEWCATKKGPKRDVLGELKQEIESRDMVFTASSHRVEHYWFLANGLAFESDIKDPPYGDLYWPTKPDPFAHPSPDPQKEGDHLQYTGIEVDEDFMQDWLARCCELVDRYQPKLIYFDWWIMVKPMRPYLKKFAAYYYNRSDEWGTPGVINYKHDEFMFHTAVRDVERGQLTNISPDFWQSDTSVARNSWGYTEGNDYKKPQEIVYDLIDVVSKNGALLLNIGPKADGTIPQEDKDILLAVGKWLEVNGEGIYDTSYWKTFGEGPTLVKEGMFTDGEEKTYTSEDFRFTYKHGSLYVFILNFPKDGRVKIKSLANGEVRSFTSLIEKAEVLGFDAKISYQQNAQAMDFVIEGVESDYPVCLKLTLD